MLLLASLTMGVKVIKTNGLGEKGQRLFLSVQWQKWQEFKSLEPCTVTVGDNWFLNLDAATKWQCSHSANAPFSYICFSYFNCAWHQGKLGRNFFDLFFDFKQACTSSCWMFWFPYLSSVKLFRQNKKMHACWLASARFLPAQFTILFGDLKVCYTIVVSELLDICQCKLLCGWFFYNYKYN